MTLKEFLDYFQQKYSHEISIITWESNMIYSNFSFIPRPKAEERLLMEIGELCEHVGKKPIPSHSTFLTLMILAATVGDGEDVDVLLFSFVCIFGAISRKVVEYTRAE